MYCAKRLTSVQCAGFIGAMIGAGSACAQQSYPARPIRLIVPYPAAGPNDMLARTVNDPLGKRLGQLVVIDNRGGAATVIGAEIASHAAPDGYTLLLATVTTLAVAPALSARLPYRPEDFVPISMLAAQPYFLGVHPGVPATTLSQLVAYAKANPGKLSFASTGVGTSGHLAGEMFKHMSDILIPSFAGNDALRCWKTPPAALLGELFQSRFRHTFKQPYAPKAQNRRFDSR